MSRDNKKTADSFVGGRLSIPLMTAKKKIILFIIGASAAFIVLAAVVFVLTFDINSYKPRIEAAASEATGLKVRINGKIGLSFFPFGLSAKDIHVVNNGGEIISTETLNLGAELMPLLGDQLKITSYEFVQPVITIIRGTDGKYNYEVTGGLPGTAFSLNALKLSKGVLVYIDNETGRKTEFKDFNLAITSLSIADTSANVIRNASFTGSFDCKEVIQGNLTIENLTAPVRAVKGTYDFEPLSIGALVYFDKKAGEKTELKGINLSIKDLLVVDAAGAIVRDILMTGTMDCKELRKKNLIVSNLKSSIKVEKGVVYFIHLTMDIFGSNGEGDVTADKSEVDAVYKINLKVSNLDFAKLEESFGAKRTIGGKGEMYASLTTLEKGNRSLMSSIDGTFFLRGDNLAIYTVDLDKVLSSYETSQEFNLVDVGVFLLAGPLGSVALKGYRYEDVYYQARTRQGTITSFSSHWKIKNGVAEAADCALATQHNRIAIKGKLNLVSEHYDNVTVALLDDKGCAKFTQSISGSFSSPKISTVSAVESLAGPFLHLYRTVRKFVEGGKCEVFYNGAVRQPSK